MDIEKLENLPSRQKFYVHVNSKGQLKADKEYSYGSHPGYRKMRAIVRGSVGKEVDYIYSRIRPIIASLHYDTVPYVYFIQHQVYHPHVFVDGQPYGTAGRHYGMKVLHGHYRDENGILQNNPYQRPKHVSRYTPDKRKDRVQRRKLRLAYELQLLKMINRPDLYRFYTQLKAKEKSLLDTVYKRGEAYPEFRRTYGYSKVVIPDPYQDLEKRIQTWQVYERWRKRDAEKAWKELGPVQKDIKELEAGNYNAFFTSNVYLYSLQKECHHFETP